MRFENDQHFAMVCRRSTLCCNRVPLLMVGLITDSKVIIVLSSTANAVTTGESTSVDSSVGSFFSRFDIEDDVGWYASFDGLVV